MRIFCSMLIVLLALATTLNAQETSGDSPWENNDSPWGNNESQTGPAQVQPSSSKTSPFETNSARGSLPKPKTTGTPSTSTVPAPIDGGLVVLLAAGALYGGKRLRNRTTASV